MKRKVKRILASMLTVVLLLTAAPLSEFDFSVMSSAAGGVNYSTGDIIELGSYPQSKLTDTALLSVLNSLSLSWVSYGYYSGTGNGNDGQMTPGDYMKYADVTYKGERYCAVKFTEYRPCFTGNKTSSDDSFQDENGYYTNTVYWFKFEPLQWRVLDPDEGFVMCESIIDSQPYNNTYYYNGSEGYQNTSCITYANDYAESSIREWLNDDFYNTAFTSSEKAEIKTTTCDNSSYSDSQYDSATTYDKIFLLSYWTRSILTMVLVHRTLSTTRYAELRVQTTQSVKGCT